MQLHPPLPSPYPRTMAVELEQDPELYEDDYEDEVGGRDPGPGPDLDPGYQLGRHQMDCSQCLLHCCIRARFISTYHEDI